VATQPGGDPPPDRAGLRLAAAMANALQSGNRSAWVTAALSYHNRIRSLAGDAGELAGLRAEILAAAEELRSSYRSRAGRLWASGDLDRVIAQLAADADDEPTENLPELFTLAEAGRARLLLDSMVLRPPRASPAVEQVESEVFRFSPSTDDDPVREELTLISALVLSVMDHDDGTRHAALVECEAGYESEAAGFTGAAEPADLAAVQAVLGPDEVLIEYVIPFSALHPAQFVSALVVTDERAELVPLPMDGLTSSGFIGSIAIDGQAPIAASPLGEEVLSTRLAVLEGRDEDARVRLGRLYDLLLAPIVQRGLLGERDHLIIAPSRVLHPVPWSALWHPTNGPLALSCSVTVVASASVLVRERAVRRNALRCITVADPNVGYAGLPQLDQARVEADAVVSALSAAELDCPEPLVGAAATWAAVAPLLPDAGIIWLATHGDFPRSDALDLHRILLSRTLTEPGPVTSEQIRALDLRQTWLTVLSVCDGGLYPFGPGDEPYGLVPAALAAGSENVIAALWPVEDHAARALLSVVAGSLAHDSPSAALRRAMAERLAAGEPIRNWAAFAATGSGRPLRAG
jgi:CHAT domain